MTIQKTEQTIIEEFENFDDWMDRYNYIIELGKSVPIIDEAYKIDSYLISGCQSRVWLHANYDNGLIYYTADSDAIITKGIVALLIRVLNERTPDEVIDAKLEFVETIGIKEHLSPTRSNGLTSMIKQMKLYAIAFKTKYKK